MKDESIQITKGLAIILMVLAHSGFSQFGDRFINMFHMPVFLFFAGYCFKDKYIENTRLFLKNKFLHIYIPYIKYSLFFLLIHNLLYILSIEKTRFVIYDFLNNGFHIFASMACHDQLLGGYWFLKDLMVASVIGYFCIKLSRIYIYIYILALIIVSIVMIELKFHIHVIDLHGHHLYSTSLFLCGFLYRKSGFSFENHIIIAPIAFLLVLIGTFFYSSCIPNINAHVIGPYTATALCGVIGLFSFGKILHKTKICKEVLVFIGNNTLVILTWHFLSFKLVSFIIIIVNKLEVSRLVDFPVLYDFTRISYWWIAYFIVGLLLPLSYKYLQKQYE